MKMGAKVQRLLEITGKVKPAPRAGSLKETPMMDAMLLARMQFAANISFHILFPTITIALGWVLLFFRCAGCKHPRRSLAAWPTASGPRCSR
jgi:hypothetical protein